MIVSSSFGNSVQAQPSLDSLQRILSKQPDNVDALAELSKQLRSNNADTAKYFGQRMLAVAKGSGNNEHFARGYNEVGIYYLYKGQLAPSNENFRQALAYSLQTTNYVLSSKIAGNIGQNLVFQYELKAAYDTLQLAETVLTKEKDLVVRDKQLIQIWGYQSMLYKELGLFQKAIDLSFLILKKLRQDEAGYAKDAAYQYGVIGNSFYEMKQFDKAIKYYHTALAVRKADPEAEHNDRVSKLCLAKAHTNLKHIDSALYWCQSIEQSLQPDDGQWLGVFQMKTEIFLQEGKKDSALLYAKKVLDFAIAHDSPEEIFGGYQLLSKAHLAGGQYAEAKKYLLQAKPFFDASPLDKLDMLHDLATVYERTGDAREALAYYRQFDSLYQVRFDELTARNSVAAEVEHETALKEAMIAEQRQQMTAQEQKNTLLLLGGGFAVFVAIGFGALYQRTRKQREKIRKQAAHIELLNEDILHSNKNSLRLLMSIFERQAEDGLQQKDAIVSRERVFTLAVLHSQLYEHAYQQNGSLKQYLTTLCSAKEAAFGVPIQLHFDCPDMALPPRLLQCIGLVFNELSTNAAKHAFEGVQKPLITVAVLQRQTDKIMVTVCDNGNGLQHEFQANNSDDSKGLGLVSDLIKPNGSIRTYNQNGACFEVSFSLN